jgi:hypothetical protein
VRAASPVTDRARAYDAVNRWERNGSGNSVSVSLDSGHAAATRAGGPPSPRYSTYSTAGVGVEPRREYDIFQAPRANSTGNQPRDPEN